MTKTRVKHLKHSWAKTGKVTPKEISIEQQINTELEGLKGKLIDIKFTIYASEDVVTEHALLIYEIE